MIHMRIQNYLCDIIISCTMHWIKDLSTFKWLGWTLTFFFFFSFFFFLPSFLLRIGYFSYSSFKYLHVTISVYFNIKTFFFFFSYFTFSLFKTLHIKLSILDYISIKISISSYFLKLVIFLYT